METAIVWFRQDLRLTDNPALNAALQQGRRVIPVYCHEDEDNNRWRLGGASRWWLHHSLLSLAADIKKSGSRLVIRQGPCVEILRELAEQTGATQIHCNALYEPENINRDHTVHRILSEQGISFHCYHGNLLNSPAQVKNQSNKPYQVFTPFYRYYLKNGFSTRVGPRPRKMSRLPATLKSNNVESLKLLPTIPWYTGFESFWRPGERGAKMLLQKFCKKHLADYQTSREFPALDGTSMLSPYLHFGEISPRQIIATLSMSNGSSTSRDAVKALDSVVRQLIWRDFAHHILVHFPHTAEHPFHESYKKFPWKRGDKKFLSVWQRGNTGIPIIDAGMRQLWQTGWMHNRVRMIVASLLTKNANLHWLHGARWFWDTLVDADLANNSMNWQWVAGCGVDAAPYFRIFNPVAQGKKFDPQGEYIKCWVPELENFPIRYIHEPWMASHDAQYAAGIIIGRDYPKPVIDLTISRRQALERYNSFRKRN